MIAAYGHNSRMRIIPRTTLRRLEIGLAAQGDKAVVSPPLSGASESQIARRQPAHIAILMGTGNKGGHS
jgi:hypothetical protein